jgi:putative transposase
MARKPRIEYPGALNHVIARGNQRRDIFCDDADRVRYLTRLKEYKSRYEFLLYAYVLMSNHVHLLIETRQTGLAKIMQGLHQTYTQGYNRRHGTVGHVLQGRYHAIVCDRETYLLQLIRYIHLNPVRARLVKDPADYPWSGHLEYIGTAPPALVDVDLVLGIFAEHTDTARNQYKSFVRDNLAEAHHPENYRVREQQLLGDDQFVEKVRRKTSVRPHDPVNRRSVTDLLNAVIRATGVAKDRITGRDRSVDAVKARRLLIQAGAVNAVPGRELAIMLGRDPSLISRLARMTDHERMAATQLSKLSNSSPSPI